MENLETNLQKLTKQEIIDMITELVTQGCITASVFNDFLVPVKMTSQEIQIVEKLSSGVPITDGEVAYIQTALGSHKKARIKNLLKSPNEFLVMIIKYKINNYFETIWKIYPRKVGKDLGRKAFMKLMSESKLEQFNDVCKYVFDRVMYYRNYCKDNNTEECYIMHFSTFCNSKKYLK